MPSWNGLPTRKEAEILELLRQGDELYGLQMVSGSNGSLKRGTIYVLLDRLEDSGFVSSRTNATPGVSGMPRRLYRITGQGQRALAALRAAYATQSAAPSIFQLRIVAARNIRQPARDYFITIAAVISLVTGLVGQSAAAKTTACLAEADPSLDGNIHILMLLLLLILGVSTAVLHLIGRYRWIQRERELLGLLHNQHSVSTAPGTYVRVTTAPGSFISIILKTVYTKKSYERVFQPLISDMQEEYFDALAEKRERHANWVHLRGYLTLILTVAAHAMTSVGKIVFKMWKLTP